MKAARNVAIGALLFLTAATAAIMVSPKPAQAEKGSSECGETWPRTASVQTTRWPGTNDFATTFSFVLTADQLESLRCAAYYLEIDFRLKGFSVPENWDDYTVEDTNLPGALHDVGYSDPANAPNPGVTRIYTSQLSAGVTYYASLSWSAPTFVGVPSVHFSWAPARWADPNNQSESALCGAYRLISEAWCMFGYENLTADLGESITGMLNGEFPFDGFRWFDFKPAPPSGLSSANSAVNYGGQQHVFYYDVTDGNLRHAWNSNGWHAETLDGSLSSVSTKANDVGRYVSAVVSDTIHVFYYDATDGDLRHAWWAYWNNRWEFETLDSGNGADVGKYVAASAYGGPHVFYYDATYGDLKHMWYANGWNSEVLDGSGYAGQYISTAQYDGGLHLFYYEGSQGDLRHAWYAGAGWQFMTLDSAGDVGKYASVANNGTLHVFYYDTTNGNLRHAWWAYWNARWEFENLDTAGNVGLYTSAVVYGDLHVFYYDATNADLKHAFYQGGWQFETLDSANVGKYLGSINHGTPHLYYYDATSGNLRHAWWASWNSRWEFEVLDGAPGTPGGKDADVL